MAWNVRPILPAGDVEQDGDGFACSPAASGPRRSPDLVSSVVIAGAAFLAGLVLVVLGAERASVDWREEKSYARWDSSHYLSIAADGYSLMRCGSAGFDPDDWCGNSGWFPGYPASGRLLSATALSPLHAGVVIPNVALFGSLVLVASLVRRHSIAERLLATVAAGSFPGAIYYRAVFPISLTVLAILLALGPLQSRQGGRAGLLGGIGAVSYPQGILVAAAATPLLYRATRCRGGELRPAIAFATVLALAAASVPATFQLLAGRWDAWLLVQEKEEIAIRFPFARFADRLSVLLLTTGDEASVPALQSALFALLVVALVVCACSNRGSLTRLQRMTVAFLLAIWLVPLAVGVSIQRAESLGLPAVLLLPVVPRWLAVATLAAFGFVAVRMSALFFVGQVI